MHELAIAESIVGIVTGEAEKLHAQRVSSVRLQIGDAMSVVSDSLLFSFEMLTSADPLLEGAQLHIDRIPHRAHCNHCEEPFTVVHFVSQCPTCQSWDVETVSGTEFRILEMEIVSIPSSGSRKDIGSSRLQQG